MRYRTIPEDQLPKTIPEAIRFCRKIHKLTQTQVGLRMGLHGSSIGKWEKGTCFPVNKHWDKLVVALPALAHYFDVEAMKRGARNMDKPGRRPGQPFNANPRRGPRGPNEVVEHIEPPVDPESRRPVQLELIQGAARTTRAPRTSAQDRVSAELARQLEDLKEELVKTKKRLHKAEQDANYCLKVIEHLKRAKEAQFLLAKVLLGEED